MFKLIRISATILVILLMVASFTNCSAVEKNDSSEETSRQTEGNQKITEPWVGEGSWTLDISPVKLDWYINFGWYDKKWDAGNTLFDKVVTEQTGVDINIIVPAGNGDGKLTSMIASGDLPDLVTLDNWSSIRTDLSNSGLFHPLNKLAEEYAPDLYKYIPESMIKWYTEEDGNWYAIANYYTGPEWLVGDAYIENSNGIIARKDIMDQLGIKPEDFTTQDGAVDALLKVKNACLKYDGKDIIPFFTQWNDWAMARMWAIPWETPEGDWQDINMHPKYLEMYKFLNRLWRHGLMHNDNFTSWAGEKISQGICFSYMGNTDDVRDSIAAAFRKDKRIVYVPVGPIHALDGEEPLYDQAGTGWTSTFITKQSRNPDRAIRLLTFLASDEGQMLTWYGVEGETYEIVDGKVRYSEAYKKMKSDNPDMAKRIYGVDTFWPLQQSMFFQRTVDSGDLPEVDRHYMAIRRYFSGYSVWTPETMGIIPDKGTREAGINIMIGEYWSEQNIRMIMAKSEEEVEHIYNAAVEHVYEMGYAEVYEACNKKYKEQKAKLGRDVSYPRH